MKNNPSIEDAVNCLQSGGTLIYPTETVLGIGCNALNEMAIEKVSEVKNRPDSKSFILLILNIDMVRQFVPNLSKKEEKLLLSQKPTTVILSNTKNLPNQLLAKDKSVGVRIAIHPVCIELIKEIDAPLVSTSANLSGESTAKSWKDLNPLILERVDYSLNLQSDFQTSDTPSRIVRVVNDEVIFIRR